MWGLISKQLIEGVIMVVSEEDARGQRRLQNYSYFWLNYKAVLKKKRASSG